MVVSILFSIIPYINLACPYLSLGRGRFSKGLCGSLFRILYGLLSTSKFMQSIAHQQQQSFVGLRLEVYGKEFRGRGSRCGVFSILSACKRVACDTPRMNAECLSHTRRLTSYEDCTLVG